METLHESANKHEADMVELPQVNHEDRFARIVAAEIAGALKVNFADRDIVVKLLTTELERVLSKRNGLLEQYLHTQLDRIGDTLRRRFDLDNSVKVNYNYATHAKLENFIEAIQNKTSSDFNGNI